MFVAEVAVGWQRTTETEGWRRVWPFTHSDLSRIVEDLRKDAEAIVCYLLCSSGSSGVSL